MIQLPFFSSHVRLYELVLMNKYIIKSGWDYNKWWRENKCD